MSLATDITLNASTTITAGTNADRVFSLLPSNANDRVQRSVASTALTAPQTLTIAHSKRVVKGMRTLSNNSVAAAPLYFDRHLCRLDTTVTQTAFSDPEFRASRSVQLTIEVPRLGAESPTTTQIIDDLLSMVSMLRASSNANLIRFLNGES
ncbi:TPA_asm: coat protein [ssRNA phage SRR7976301_11]|uniref:Coat protein n=1 Tax=ssRNA phage SRR7976301_11 TaxID=2786661 RepID=A0A8S5L5D6_9VIRU|nr:coat protein [ssRNA phage SRR7976301_11]DAD52684.1 TPA_asm: coat protein [ssRNA phage SRR7976301_11]